MDILLRNSRKLQETLNEIPTLSGRPMDSPPQCGGIRRQLRAEAFFQQKRKSVEMMQRCPQIVRNGEGKRLQLRLGSLQVASPFANSLLQLRGVLLHLAVQLGVLVGHRELRRERARQPLIIFGE